MGEVLLNSTGFRQRQLPAPNPDKNGKDKVSPTVWGEVQCQGGC